MDSAASKWDRMLHFFLPQVMEANIVEKACMEAFKRAFEQALAHWEARVQGSGREGRESRNTRL
jgi:hypothetical protein